MSRAELVTLSEIERCSVRRACDVQRAILALQSALDHAEQADAMARVMWPDGRHERRRASAMIREALRAVCAIQRAQGEGEGV